MQSQVKTIKNIDYCRDLYKIAFLSFHISFYVSIIQRNNSHNKISVNEIYNFIDDVKRDMLMMDVPKINKEDISLCFHILERLGICDCLE